LPRRQHQPRSLFLADDSAGLGAVLDTVGRLAGDSRLSGPFPYWPPDLRRLRIQSGAPAELGGKYPTWLPCGEGSGQDGSVTPPWLFLERPSNDCPMGFHFAGAGGSLPAAAVQQISVALPF
jgi:hypothetical protein